MEKSIGYEALFSSDEWESLTFGSWDDPDLDPYDLSSLSDVVTIDGEGCAAPSQATPERILPDLGVEFTHEVSCRTRQLDDGTTEYVLECDICEEIGTADDYEEADVIAQQHKTFTTELIG